MTRNATEGDRPRFATEIVAGGSGPFMLMIHGMLSSRAQWVRNKQALSELCRPVLIDLWGHGVSPVPTDASSYTLPGLIDAIEALRVDLQAEQIVLCTQSFGAGLGLHYCLQHPQRVLAYICLLYTSPSPRD